MQTVADIVITNARVMTMDKDNPRCEALAIAGNRILAVGSVAEIADFKGPATRTVDAKGASVLPGFNESHLHIFGGSVGLSQLSLFKLQGFDALKAALLDYAAAHPDLHLLVGQYASYAILSNDERLTRHHLDSIIPERPVLLFASDHHTAWANTAALEAAGILHGADVGVGNEIVMGKHGRATGELHEANAISPVASLSETEGREGLGVGTGGEPESVTQAQRAADIAILQRGLDYCASLGITSIQNMDGNLYQLEMIEEIEETTGLPVRVRIPFHMKNFMDLSVLEERAVVWRERFRSDRLKSDFVKMFVDGVTESGTAFFIEDYATQPGWRGEPLFTQEHFNRVAVAADALGMQIAVHAIGDGAVREALDGYAAAIRENGRRDSRHRIEHIEVVHPDDIPRFAELGTVASMQPVHSPGSAGLPLEPYLSDIGEERWAYAFAWRMLKDAGARIVFATDWPVSPLDPLLCIREAMVRKVWKQGLPDQRLTLEDTLAAYTSESAWVEFMEDRKGKLKPGYLADVVVLSADIEVVEPQSIHEIRALVTVCDGKVTWDADAARSGGPMR